MVDSCLSFVSIYGSFLRRSLAAAGLSSQTIDIDSDTTVHFWGPSAATSKPPLVLIHGFGPHGVWQWRPQISFFAREFDVYIPDLLFFGDSFTKCSDRSEVFQAASVAKLLEKLRISRYSVVGTSYGGFVAYRMAAMWPERVEKVVIASSGVNMRRSDNSELLKRAKMENIEDFMLPSSAVQMRTLIGLAVFRRPYIPDFFLNDFINKLYRENRKEKLELLKGLTLGQDDTDQTISPLPQEVLIVWGEHDQIFLLEKAIELHKLLGERAKLQIIKKTSHVPQLEQAGQFNNIVKDFLNGLS
ncbi:hypothetical protein ABFX02_05G137900 [Erythranthe guttata]